MIEIGGVNKKLTSKIRLFFDSLNQNWKSLSQGCHVADPPLLAFSRLTCGMLHVILYKRTSVLVAQVTSGVQSAFATCALENRRTRELTCHFMRLGECATRACEFRCAVAFWDFPHTENHLLSNHKTYVAPKRMLLESFCYELGYRCLLL